jgi:hypothetical protein
MAWVPDAGLLLDLWRTGHHLARLLNQPPRPLGKAPACAAE